jgi:hypothetical protein
MSSQLGALNVITEVTEVTSSSFLSQPVETSSVRSKIAMFEQKSGIATAPPVPRFRVRRRLKEIPPKQEEDNFDLDDDGNYLDTTQKIPLWCARSKDTMVRQCNIDPLSVFGGYPPVCVMEDIFPGIERKESKEMAEISFFWEDAKSYNFSMGHEVEATGVFHFEEIRD